MRFSFKALAAGGILVAVGCQAGGTTATLETEDQKASYAIGLNVGGSLEQAADLLDMAAFQKGVEDAMSGADPSLPPEELDAAVNAFRMKVQAAASEAASAAADKNQAEGEAYLAENGARDGVQITESGLQYEVLREGDGPSPEPGASVTLHYRGTLIDGTEFDSSYERGEPATFNVGQVIPGFAEGIQLMEVGSHYRLHIPGSLGYGPQGSAPNIGPNATLIFEVELLEIQ